MRLLDDDEVAEIARSAQSAPLKPMQRVPSGFPSPAEDMAERRLNLADLLVSRPSVYFLEMTGDALAAAGVFDKDMLVVDRALTPLYGRVVVAEIAGEFVARYYCPEYESIYLLAASEEYAPLYIADAEKCVVWGVVTATIHYLPPLR